GGGLYSTFLGGTSADEGKGLVVDSGGIIHVTGYTDSANFPTAGNPYSNTHAGGRDVFVAKFDSTGAGVDDLIYSTFLGGSSAETGNAIELDNFGNVYITGDTISTDFPTTADAYQGSLSTIDFTDAFVTKIDLTGSNLSYSSYLGGTDDDVGYVVDIDSSGNAYITGSTASSNFPTASFQIIYGGAVDAFVAKFELGAGSPPATPAAVSPVDEQRFATADPVNLQAGAFSDSDGDSHLSSFWKVRFAGSVYGRTDYDASFDFEDTTGNLTTHTVDGLLEGMKYVWKVKYTDSAGNSSPYSTERSFKVGTSQAESLPQVDNGTTTADFGMISFVHWPDDDKATSVINITYDSKYYRIGTYDPTIGGYIEYGSSLTIEPGKAYWVLAREGLSINYSGVPVSLLADMDVKLEYKASTGNGWNMIACPNAANYLWVDIEIVKYNADGSIAFGPTAIADLPYPNAYIDKRLWRWDNGSYDDSTTLMEKYEGYWVQVKQADVYLHFPASAQASLSSPKIMLAALTNKTGRWLNKWILAPKAAIADAGDSPPMPMGGFSSSSESKSGASCFVATAAYGSAMAPHVNLLREFRDRFLLTNNIGKAFVAFYYKHSPDLAGVIEKHANLKAAMRISLLPIVGASWVALKFGPIATMAILILPFIGFIIRRRKVDKNKK
ncbi:MAG: SBBP repeat-containing protein, partial [Desulfobacterales bacterium]